ncbi:MAG: GtrA family protein [Burkholderiaceae bacterium]
MKWVADRLRDPQVQRLDVDGGDRLRVHGAILARKPMLQQVFTGFHHLFERLDRRYLRGDGLRVEIGAGVAPIRDSYPDVLATDIVAGAGLDRVLDAENMDLADGSVRVVFGQNCFHHFPHPERFFKELQRVLPVGGGAILLEPYHGPIASLLFKRLFDTEGYDRLPVVGDPGQRADERGQPGTQLHRLRSRPARVRAPLPQPAHRAPANLQQLPGLPAVGRPELSPAMARRRVARARWAAVAGVAARSLAGASPRGRDQERGLMRFARYLLVQVAAYGIDMGSFVLLHNLLQTAPLPANAVGKVLAGVFAYLSHSRFTFGLASADRSADQVVKYALLLALNLPLSALALWIMLMVVPSAVPAKFLADAVCVFLTYWLSKRFVFLNPAAPASPVAGHKGGE